MAYKSEEAPPPWYSAFNKFESLPPKTKRERCTNNDDMKLDNHASNEWIYAWYLLHCDGYITKSGRPTTPPSTLGAPRGQRCSL